MKAKTNVKAGNGLDGVISTMKSKIAKGDV